MCIRDSYITKPCSLAILRARVNTQLKRSAVKKENIILTGPYTFDFEHLVYRKNGSLVELSHTEQKLLKILVENRGHAVSRASMVDRIWTVSYTHLDVYKRQIMECCSL